MIEVYLLVVNSRLKVVGIYRKYICSGSMNCWGWTSFAVLHRSIHGWLIVIISKVRVHLFFFLLFSGYFL